MKKFRLLLLLAVASTFAFVSCDKDEDLNPPTVTVADTEGWRADTVTFTVTMNSNQKLEELVITPDTDVSQGVTITEFSGDHSATYEYKYVIGGLVEDGDYITVTFKVTDDKDLITTKSAKIDIVEPAAATTDLGAATAFTWERVGGNDATGLSPFGLEWTENGSKATYAYVEKGTATKFVELTSAQWTSITTQEDLATAVDAGTDMATWKEVDATANATYDVVLATKVGDEYYMMHVTNATSVFTTSTTVTITGESKN